MLVLLELRSRHFLLAYAAAQRRRVSIKYFFPLLNFFLKIANDIPLLVSLLKALQLSQIKDVGADYRAISIIVEELDSFS